MKVPGSVIEVLRNEPLEQTEGVLQCVIALNKLMAVVNRNFGGKSILGVSISKSDMFFLEMSDMQAVKERIAMYRGAANHFARRLAEYLEAYFKVQVSSTGIM